MEEDGQPGPSGQSDSGTAVSLDTIPLHSTNLLTVLDETGTILYESPAIERVLGFEPDELVGRRVADYFHPEDRDRVVEAFRTVVASGAYTVESVEYRHERADGSYQWVESVASSDPTPGGNYVVNTRDMAERKARERQLERSNERLQAFASVVSHDLRNPLNVARGRLALAREEVDSEHLDDVVEAHERMETLIEDLLALARTGESVRDDESVDLGALSESCWRTVETGEADIEVATGRTIRADRSRVRQLLDNLFRNSVQHGGEAITVTVGELEDGAGFYVEDDGQGVSEDRREQVFESGHSGEVGGTGFGLTIVAEVADAHGWEVDLTEGEAGGARFEVTGVEFE